MTTDHRCLACGYQGPEVQMTIVEIPANEQRVKEQGFPVSWDVKGRVLGMEYRPVTERFAREPRCRDYNPKPGQPSKCRARIAEAEAELARQRLDPIEPPRADAEEEPSWLRQP
jgi:hypothetical protein